MDPLTIAGIMSLISGGISILGGAKGGKKAGEAAREEARVESEITAAKLDELKRSERVLKGQTVASVAGSGVKVGMGSPMQIYAEQAREFARQRAIVAKVGATKAQAGLQRGSMVAQQSRFTGLGQGLTQATSAFTLFAG